jgi:hypothetical protein
MRLQQRRQVCRVHRRQETRVTKEAASTFGCGLLLELQPQQPLPVPPPLRSRYVSTSVRAKYREIEGQGGNLGRVQSGSHVHVTMLGDIGGEGLA